MRAGAASVLIGALLAAAPAAAQHGELLPVSANVSARLVTMPQRLGMLDRVESRMSRMMFGYQGRDALDPVITVVLSDVTRPADLRALAGTGRAEPIRVGLLETLFEGRFSVPGQPGAVTFFGDYLTKEGVRQSWIAEYGGVRITISAKILRADDRRMVFDAIRGDLLGGAEMTGKVTPAETN